MQYVPVVSKTGKPLMPCHPARVRELVRAGRAMRRFNRGIFYIQLLDREDGDTQEVVVGVDPGSKKEGFTVKSEAHTYLNVQADAVTWVGKQVEQRRRMRRGRRYRQTPYRRNRSNRAQGGIPPSTRARWWWKLRILNWLAKLYPITHVVVEDIKARTWKNGRRWNVHFSPLEVGKQWFYGQIRRKWSLETRQGWETKEMRESLGLKKSSAKRSDRFEAHCVDSWVLANGVVGGHLEPDNVNMVCVVPLRLHRRQLHRLQPSKGGVRKPYGGTVSLGLRRGSWVKHPKWGLAYVGGTMKNRISLHCLKTGKRLTQYARPEECSPRCYASWRAYVSSR